MQLDPRLRSLGLSKPVFNARPYGADFLLDRE
jgi:hypothetical protein